jgi:hypothetical protein
LVGTWQNNEVKTIFYTFNKDGTGVQLIKNDTFNFVYTVNDNNLSLQFGNYGGGDLEEYEYSINGDTLNLTRAGDKRKDTLTKTD